MTVSQEEQYQHPHHSLSLPSESSSHTDSTKQATNNIADSNTREQIHSARHKEERNAEYEGRKTRDENKSSSSLTRRKTINPQTYTLSEWKGLYKWVEQIRATYHCELTIPPCWYQHDAMVYELAGLWSLWREIYEAPNPQPNQPIANQAIAWHEYFHSFLVRCEDPRRYNHGCTSKVHKTVPSNPSDLTKFYAWLKNESLKYRLLAPNKE